MIRKMFKVWSRAGNVGHQSSACSFTDVLIYSLDSALVPDRSTGDLEEGGATLRPEKGKGYGQGRPR